MGLKCFESFREGARRWHIFLAVLLLISAQAVAKEDYPFAFARNFNRDADVRISISEWMQGMNWAFAFCDNGDGKLSSREISECASRIFQMDKNNDGIITSKEWKNSSSGFRFWDSNSDGQISISSELNAIFTPLLPLLEKEWQKWDADASKSLSSGEYQNWVMFFFNSLDRNGDRLFSDTDGVWKVPAPQKGEK